MSEPTNTASPASKETTTPVGSRGPSVRQIAVVVAILAAGLVVTALTSDVAKVSEPGIRLVDKKPYLPEKAGAWQGGELQGLSKGEIEVLPKDTLGARRIYKDAASNEIYCAVILAGHEVTSIHRPELCLPAQGWIIEEEHTEIIPAEGAPGGRLPVMRMSSSHTMPQGGRVDCVFVYWFVGHDRITAQHWQRIMWTTMDRVFRNRNHRWAYFLIQASVKSAKTGEDLKRGQDQATKLISQFVQAAYPELLPR